MRSLLAAFLAFFATFAFGLDFPPSPRQLVAVNPITNKVYLANESAGTVTVLDAAHNTTKTIAVGSRPQFIVVNPITNRVFVNNGADATLSVIDGETDTNLTPTALALGTQGPMAINTETNIVYEVRMTGLGTDEVTYFDAGSNQWYTIATESFQPTALTINPFTNTLYVAHYGTGDVRVISGAYDNNAHPATLSIPAWSHPFAIAANAMTNKVYVITEDSRGPIGVIDGATNTPTWLAPLSGHAVGPKALAIDPVNNKAYALFSGEVIVVNPDNSLTYIPVATGTGVASLGINFVTNKIYVANDSGSMTVIDGDTNTTASVAIPAGSSWVGINPVTNEAYVFDGANATIVDGSAADPTHGNPLITNVTHLAGDTSGPSGSISLSPTNLFSNPLPVKAVYYQIDSKEGAWIAAGSAGGPYNAAYSGLSAGPHTLYAFAIEGHASIFDTGPQSIPLLGTMASYTFTVSSAPGTSTTSLASSVNPSTVGQSVTFTASVSGGGATPTGTVTFRDGGTAICTAVALSSGSATCTTSSLAAGGHAIAASYSGDSSYSASSASLTQTVNKSGTTTTVSSSVNPSQAGQSVTFTATVTGGSATPTGAVTFNDGSTALCSAVALSSGSATCTTSSLAAGSHTVTATYAGDAGHSLSAGSVTQVVNGGMSEITSPAPGATLAGASVTFSWTPGTNVSTRYLLVGSTVNGQDLFSGYVGASSQSVTVPTDGRTIYVQLGSYINGAWQTFRGTYTAATGSGGGGGGTPPPSGDNSTITSPAPGSTLTGSTLTLTWTQGNNVSTRYLVAGSSQGGQDLFSGYVGASGQSFTVPTDGRTIYVQLGSYINGAWQTFSATYMAASGSGGGGGGTPPPSADNSVITSPTSGSTLTGSTLTLTWSAGTNVQTRYLMVGSSQNGQDVFSGYVGASSQSLTVPTDGRTLYVQLGSYINGAWQVSSATYATSAGGTTTPPATAKSEITTPAPGSQLMSTTTTFGWTAGSGITYRYLIVGTSPGAQDVFSGYVQGTSQMVNVPQRMGIYVQLGSYINGAWQMSSANYAGPM